MKQMKLEGSVGSPRSRWSMGWDGQVEDVVGWRVLENHHVFGVSEKIYQFGKEELFEKTK